jgi:hypothetical protein
MRNLLNNLLVGNICQQEFHAGILLPLQILNPVKIQVYSEDFPRSPFQKSPEQVRAHKASCPDKSDRTVQFTSLSP